MILDENVRHKKYNVVFHKKGLGKRGRKIIIIIISSMFSILLILFILAFVILPLVFMNSIYLQRLVIFTNFNQPTEKSYFQKFETKVPGLRNFYRKVEDLGSKKNVELGVWHFLSHEDSFNAFRDKNYDFKSALKNTTNAVLLYFHGAGETRDDQLEKFKILQISFHVIAFDYRSYGDSTQAPLYEKSVVNDCVQLYEWLANQTEAPIYIWGHSLGSSLATYTVSLLTEKDYEIAGLILEGAFTSIRDELYYQPYGKFFSWLPYFEATIVAPLIKNGFNFDTKHYIRSIESPIMILSAEDDGIVDHEFSKKLYEIVKKQGNYVEMHKFPASLEYNHFWLYKDPFLTVFLKSFLNMSTEN